VSSNKLWIGIAILITIIVGVILCIGLYRSFSPQIESFIIPGKQIIPLPTAGQTRSILPSPSSRPTESTPISALLTNVPTTSSTNFPVPTYSPTNIILQEKTPMITATRDTTCPNRGNLTLLIVWAESKLASKENIYSMMITKLDFASRSITVIQLPTNLLLSGKTLTAINIKELQIAQVYEYVAIHGLGNPLQVKLSAANLVGQVLQDNFGFAVPNQMIIDTTSMFSLVDKLGGIEIVLPEDHADLKKGGQILNSQQIDMYLFEKIISEKTRTSRISLVLDALRHQLLGSNSRSNLIELFQDIRKEVLVNPDIIQISADCLVDFLDPDRVKFEGIDPGFFVTQPDGSLKIAGDQYARFLQANLGK